MAIIPGSAQFPGIRQRIRVRRGPSQVGENERILLLGYRATTASAAFDLVPQRVLDENDAILLFGEGSQIALMARKAFAVGPLARQDVRRGTMPQVWCMAVEPPTGTPSAHTLSVTGPATAASSLPLEVGDERGSVAIENGDSDADIAAKIDTAIQGLERNLPATSASALAVATLTAREDGEYTNELFIWADDRRTPGVTVTEARSVDGVGVVDLTAALEASEAGDWAIIALPQEDTATRDKVEPHIEAMWDEDTARLRRVIMPHSGLLSAAETDAQAIDDWRGVVCSLERVVGVGTAWDPSKSSRAFSWEGAAALAARLESQLRANWSFNVASIPVGGRPLDTLTAAVYDTAHQAGVTIITEDPSGRARGVISDPISTATTDQTGVTAQPDLAFLPIEIARVVRRVAALAGVKLAGFFQADATADELTRVAIKSATLSVLNEAASNQNRWVEPPSDTDVTVVYVLEGGGQVAEASMEYDVITGINKVRIKHSVGV